MLKAGTTGERWHRLDGRSRLSRCGPGRGLQVDGRDLEDVRGGAPSQRPRVPGEAGALRGVSLVISCGQYVRHPLVDVLLAIDALGMDAGTGRRLWGRYVVVEAERDGRLASGEAIRAGVRAAHQMACRTSRCVAEGI